MKLITGLAAVGAYGVAAHLLFVGFPPVGLWVAIIASAAAIALIVIEWSRTTN